MPKPNIPTTMTEMLAFLAKEGRDANAILGLLHEVRMDERDSLRNLHFLTSRNYNRIRKQMYEHTDAIRMLEDHHIAGIIEAFFEQRLAPRDPRFEALLAENFEPETIDTILQTLDNMKSAGA